MRHIITSAMTMILLLILCSGCTRFRGSCDECCCRREYRELWDRYDCPNWNRNVIMPREFFDPRDFHPDSIYGDPRGWRHDDYSRFYDECRYHGGGRRWESSHRYHRHGYRSHDADALSERHLPPPAPDMEYDE